VVESLTERVEVRVSDRTHRQLRREARARGLSVAEFVREAIEQAIVNDVAARLRAADALFNIEASTADWADMEREIDEAHLEAKMP
jgi:predicted DNA-binding protein